MNLNTLTEITTTKLADNSVTVAKLASDVDTWIAGKQATISGGATTILTSNLGAGKVLISDANGKVGVSTNVTSAELEFVNGVTSNIQTQLNTLGVADYPVDILVIAGGGAGGGYHHSGGGGAGGMLAMREKVASAQDYSVLVGAGGAGNNSTDRSGALGGTSSFTGGYVRIYAQGGGGGGSYNSWGLNDGTDGGSGGGSSGYNIYRNSVGTAGQGNAGGNGL